MTKKSFYKVKNETYKVIRHYPSKGDADGPLPRALLRMVPRGGGAAIAKGPQGHYVIYLDRSGKIDGAPVWLKPAQYKRAMSYEYSEEREMGNLDQLIEDLRSGAEPLAEASGLTKSDMSRLLKKHKAGQGGYIRNKNNPGWGKWQVVKQTTHKGSTWWDIRGNKGTKALHTGELHFWEEAS